MNPVFVFTALGPLVGGAGWFFSIGWLFWVGATLAAINLFLNLASGAMKLPILPTALMIVGGAALNPWYRGVAAGLLVWTALESLGEIWSTLKSSRRVA